MSLACAVNFLLAGLLALTVPQLIQALGATKLLGLFAGLDAAAALLVWLLLPGTVEVVTLEEMNYIFGVPTWKHVQYQLKTVLPWIVKRCIPWMCEHYVLRRFGRPESGDGSSPPLVSLYRWNNLKREAQEM
ncbi:hypothetical protein LTR04_001044 [Oleoguttula sp. CCFEE 6159]|nr:hypothetical protein LTR04_001044 [Oleoguttula sp. CCFEE 6159]